MTPLGGAEISEWVALRRVRGGGVAQVGYRWVESGHRLPGHLSVALGGLLASGLIRLTHPDPTTPGLRRAALTHAGIDRYEQLSQQALQLPAAQFIALCRYHSGPPIHRRRPRAGRKYGIAPETAGLDRDITVHIGRQTADNLPVRVLFSQRASRGAF